ncbi:response regulator transcription factor [Pseudonocardia halophobica]|uniref:response regulator transcription factor n=1 Tax=Pseudonocardia halophobica TaxID=29401 RepID=UPI003D915DBD
MAQFRLLLVDDHQMRAEAIAAGLSVTPDIWVLGRAGTDDPKLGELVGALRPDVVTLAVSATGEGAASLVEQIHSTWPDARIVVLAEHRDRATAAAVARAGADAWADMDVSLHELVTLLCNVHQGAASYPPDLLGHVLTELRAAARRPHSDQGPLGLLSAREREVMVRMVAGQNGTQIARDMFLSANTVRTHTRSILAKLRVHSRLEAVAVARAAGLRSHRIDEPRRSLSGATSTG